ncbi:MAG: hypothetical protein IT442_02385 [Phycisphaeraceae bacterium]|nr:hypothetical protein [Phycisphaeraceae bacterium]
MTSLAVMHRHKPAFVREHNLRRIPSSAATEAVDPKAGRVPRVARLMALAIRLECLLDSGAARDQAQLAEMGHVTRARVTQIMRLLHLAPDIQEELLALPWVVEGKDPICERQVRALAMEPNWRLQRAKWRQLIH